MGEWGKRRKPWRQRYAPVTGSCRAGGVRDGAVSRVGPAYLAVVFDAFSFDRCILKRRRQGWMVGGGKKLYTREP